MFWFDALTTSSGLDIFFLTVLTKSDLDQIKKAVREEVETEGSNTKKSLKTDILVLGARVQNAIKDLSSRTKNLEIGQKALGEKIDRVDKKLEGVQGDISEILTAIDQHQSMLENRVYRLEEEVGLSSQ